MGPKLRSRSRRNAARGSGGDRARNIRRRFGHFDGSRLADMERHSEHQSSREEKKEDLDSSSQDFESESEAGIEPESQDKPYASLLKSFAENPEQPATKRRKVVQRMAQPASYRALDGGRSRSMVLSEDRDLAEESSGPIYGADEDYSGFGEAYRAGQDEESQAGDSEADKISTEATDPFETHFSQPNEEEVGKRLRAIGDGEWLTTKSTANDSRFIFSIPQGKVSGDRTIIRDSLPLPVRSTHELKLKHRLSQAALEAKQTELDPTQQKIAPLIFNYLDLLFCERTAENGDSLRRIVCLHAVNHVFKTRDKILKNNEKIARSGEDDDIRYADQGYTRPKVLILLPTRQSCVRMVDAICSICHTPQQENRKRFEDAYVDREAKVSDDRPADFRDLFDGNNDDMFRLGLKFTRNSIKYFSQFYNSDIILASPLGLRMAMGSDDTMAYSAKSKTRTKTDYDFLSSIEIVLVDQADSLLMQNWEHVEYIFDKLNVKPRETRKDCDFSRLRSWYLGDQSEYYRQTIVFSAFHTPGLGELFRRHGRNWAGKVRVQSAAFPGSVGRLGVHGVKQTFSRCDPPSVESDPDTRFDYFVKVIVPALITKGSSSNSISGATINRNSGILVFVPSYLDFVRIRNWFATAAAVANITFGAVSEYASVSEASRAFSHFLTGRHRVLLYTERAHHFRRQQINGVRTVIFYGLPENPIYYTEIAGGYLARSQRSRKLEVGQGVVRVLFSKFDALKLERVVGSQRVGRMIRDQSDTFVFEEERTS